MTAAVAGMKKRKKKRRLNLGRFIPMLALALALVFIAGHFANRMLEKRTYRLVYAGEIQAAAGEFGLDPYLVAAVIFAESGGDREAVSPKGAVGLMQIMPATGAWIAEKLTLEPYSDESLVVARDNIRLGCWYLAYLLERYGDGESALAAYNAGPGNVDKWLSDERNSSDGKLSDSPFEETAQYVVRVQSAYEKYMELYDGQLD